MNVFSRVLIPLDGSKACERALRLLDPVQLARAAVTLLRVVSSNEIPAAERYLKGLADSLGAAKTTILVRGGDDPAWQILSEVARGRYDLVVLMAHGRGAIKRWMLGSITRRLLQECSVPLLLGNSRRRSGPGDSMRKMLVPLDGSEQASAVLETVEALCRESGCEATLFTAGPVQLTDNPLSYSRAMDESRHSAEAKLRPLVSTLVEAGAKATALVKLTSPVEGILQAIESTGSDMVVMTAPRKTGPSRLLRSVAERVFRASPVPMLLVPQDPAPSKYVSVAKRTNDADPLDLASAGHAAGAPRFRTGSQEDYGMWFRFIHWAWGLVLLSPASTEAGRPTGPQPTRAAKRVLRLSDRYACM